MLTWKLIGHGNSTPYNVIPDPASCVNQRYVEKRRSSEPLKGIVIWQLSDAKQSPSEGESQNQKKNKAKRFANYLC
jgi:hypothetical protein